VRGPAPAHPTSLSIIKAPYSSYGPPGSTQPKFVEFIPTQDFQRIDA